MEGGWVAVGGGLLTILTGVALLFKMVVWDRKDNKHNETVKVEELANGRLQLTINSQGTLIDDLMAAARESNESLRRAETYVSLLRKSLRSYLTREIIRERREAVLLRALEGSGTVPILPELNELVDEPS